MSDTRTTFSLGNAASPLNRWDRYALVVFAFTFCAIGFMVEYRSAFLTRRMGDLDCFLRAGWAVRNGEDIYAVTSDNDWHYNYPPLYAILVSPLADPPRGAETGGYVVYPVSVAICFLINMICLLLGVHILASAVEETTLSAQPRFTRRWWWLRLAPIVVCLLPIGHTLVRGQVNVVILAILCAAAAGWMRGQSFRAGLWLSLAICIKVIPAFLLVYPLWKRDWRAFAGCSVGLFVGLALIPGVTFGPTQTIEHYKTYGRVFFGPLLKLNEDDSRKEEILGGVNATESIGVRNALHNWMYPDVIQRPADLAMGAKLAYVVLGLAMTLLTLWPSSRRERAGSVSDGPRMATTSLTLQALILLMALFSPVCHSHYLLFALPLVMGLIANAWQTRTTLDVPWHLHLLFALYFWTMAVAYLPGMEILKDRCAALFATLPLWLLPIAQRFGRLENLEHDSGRVISGV